jgi:hypothetical protein
MLTRALTAYAGGISVVATISMRPILLFLSLGVLIIGCAAPPPPFNAVADVKQLMVSVIDPAADVVWGSVGTTITEAGTVEHFPKTDEEWGIVLTNALIVMESGNLLMIGDRARDNGEWMKRAQELINAGAASVKAAEARDPQAIMVVGEQIYNACAACHQDYLETGRDAPR